MNVTHVEKYASTSIEICTQCAKHMASRTGGVAWAVETDGRLGLLYEPWKAFLMSIRPPSAAEWDEPPSPNPRLSSVQRTNILTPTPPHRTTQIWSAFMLHYSVVEALTLNKQTNKKGQGRIWHAVLYMEGEQLLLRLSALAWPRPPCWVGVAQTHIRVETYCSQQLRVSNRNITFLTTCKKKKKERNTKNKTKTKKVRYSTRQNIPLSF